VCDEATKRVAKDLEEILRDQYPETDLNNPAVMAQVIARGAVMAAREVLGELDAAHSSDTWFRGDEGWQSGPLPEMVTRAGRSAPLASTGFDLGTKFGAPVIICRACDTLSYHPQHFRNRYCPGCDVFHRVPDIPGNAMGGQG
jgi:hypothetical protein